MADETKKKPAAPKKEKEAKPEAVAVDKSAAKPASEKPAVEKEKAPKKSAPAGEAPAAAPGEAAKPAEAPVVLTAAELLGEDAAGKKIIKAKHAKNIVSGVANILATFNNTQVTITDMHGNLIGWSTAGRAGFKGSRKSTAYAAQQVAQDAARQAMAHGMKEVEIRVKGPGSGRESAIRALQAIGLDISAIKDVTPVPT